MSDQDKKDGAEATTGRGGGGDSGGGPYPNPHGGKKPEKDGFFGSGGQTGMGYHGTGQLGDEKTGENANAPAKG
jgi:hypothetical protein